MLEHLTAVNATGINMNMEMWGIFLSLFFFTAPAVAAWIVVSLHGGLDSESEREIYISLQSSQESMKLRDPGHKEFRDAA